MKTGLATDFNPEPNYRVTSTVADGGKVYAGGYFSSIGLGQRAALAQLSGPDGNATAWNARISSSYYETSVYTMGQYGPFLYVDGSFDEIGGATRDGLTALHKATATADDWRPADDVYARCLAFGSEMVFVGGRIGPYSYYGSDGLAAYPSAVAGVGEGEGEGEGEGGGEGEDPEIGTMAGYLLRNFELVDADDDGFISAAEAAARGTSAKVFDVLDSNADNVLSRAELEAAAVAPAGCDCAGTAKARLQDYYGDLVLLGASLMVLVAMRAAARR